MLYEPNIKLSDLTFDDLYYRMKPRMEFHCHHNINLIKGYEFDDLFQELSCKLWVCKIPDSIIYFDWRFLRYMDNSFRLCLYDLARKKMSQKKCKNGEVNKFFRDKLDHCDPIPDNFFETN